MKSYAVPNFVLGLVLLSAAAAQADPANLANQATLVRFTNKISFGAPRQTQRPVEFNAAFADLTAFQSRRRSSPHQGVNNLGPAEQIVIPRKP